MAELPKPREPATAVAPAQRTGGTGQGEHERIEWLFRESLRRRAIHPLMPLIQRHRSVQQP